MQANTEAELAHTVALEKKVNMATVEIPNMKSIMQTMTIMVQVMQSMIISSVSAGLADPGCLVGKRPKRQS